MEEQTKYIYLGRRLDFEDFRFNKGSIYFGDLIEKKLEKYPLLKKVLVNIEDLPNIEQNEALFENAVKQLEKQIKEEGGTN